MHSSIRLEPLETRTLLSFTAHQTEVELFRDLDRDGTRDANEAGLAGWWVLAENLRAADGSATSAWVQSDAQGVARFTTYLDDGQSDPTVFRVPRSARYWCTNRPSEDWAFVAGPDAQVTRSDGSSGTSFALSDQIVVTGSVFTNFIMTDGGGGASEVPLVGRRVYHDVNGNAKFDANEPYAISDLNGEYRLKLRAGDHELRIEQPDGWAAPKGGRAMRSVSVNFYDNPIEQIQAAPTFSSTMIRPMVIDVAIGYTTAAANGRDDKAMLAHVRQLMADANRPYANSDTNVVLNLVRVQRTTYVESGKMGRDLDRLTARADGYADDVTKMRDRFKADVAILLTSAAKTAGGLIGLSYEFVRGGSPNLALGIVGLQNKPSDWETLSHEIAHTLGAGHDLETSTGILPADYAHGIRFRANDGKFYKDLMAYGSGTVLPFFSTPRFTWGGKPLGDARSMDNARIIEESAAVVARYR